MASNDLILVSVPEMEAAIQKYENARSTIQDAFTKLQSAKDHLDNCYKGSAYLALCAKWTNIYTNLKTADIAVDEAVDGLKKTISQMTDVETSVTNQSSALNTGSSSPVYNSNF